MFFGFVMIIYIYFKNFHIFKRPLGSICILILCYILVMSQKGNLLKNLLAVSDLGSVDQEAANGFAYVATW